MSSQIERTLVRLLVSVAICAALFIAALVPAPVLPAIAFGQLSLYRLEVALLVFYGVLLLITPAYLGLIRGRLPIEISTRGAKFAEGADRWTALDEAAIRNLEEIVDELAETLTEAEIEIERLNEIVGSDSTQREVGSKR